jgi:hypothetical protein
MTYKADVDGDFDLCAEAAALVRAEVARVANAECVRPCTQSRSALKIPSHARPMSFITKTIFEYPISKTIKTCTYPEP